MDSLVQNNKDIFLSIIIPVYNTEKYLKKCLDSVLEAVNNISSCEIIVINDGSIGDTDAVMGEYLNNKIIRYFKNNNQGIGATRNFGIEKSMGKYVTFVDSDDAVDKKYYTYCLKKIEEEKCDIIVCDFESCRSEDDKFRTHAKNPAIKDDKWGCIDISIMPSPCNKIVKKELYDGIKYPIGLVYEDLAITLILLLKAEKVIYVPKMFYKYYMRENSIMHSNFSEKKFQIIKILEILFEKIDNLNITKEDKDRAKNSVSYDRIYFELLEPLSKEKNKNRYILSKKLCLNIKEIIKKLNENEYYKKQLDDGRKVKKIYSKLVNFALYNNLPFLLCRIVKNSVYYNNQYNDDMWRKSK
ncbi:MAG: hypothetical protein K0R72_368 [Clostridia bacterium]|jgi:glycosyltransferase involved in cell wall biosynthesis|nr:hypothetical protein [Clostridia bacterium]